MKVIGTAGHIDHGKSALVRALTGVDPDRLAEEKARGMTIELGFAPLTLPSGATVSMIDVPGHEHFIKSMLAGAGGLDAALLVVAADEGVMPQTREHLDILKLLAIDAGVIAITKADLVDDEMIELVADEVRAAVAGTGLHASTVVTVSSTTGEGMDALLIELDRVVAATPVRHDRGEPHLPIDRVFVMPGFGTVVTGTLRDGRLKVGEEVEIVPAGRLARVRGMQTHGRATDIAEPGDRVAINLSGVSAADVRRGDVIACPGLIRPTSRFDARLTVLPSAQFPLVSGASVALHIGALESPATLMILDRDEVAPGAEAWVQLRTPWPIPALPVDRFVLRLPAPARTVAGGSVVDVAPKHRLHDPAAVDRLKMLSSRSPVDVVLGMLAGGRARSARSIALDARLEFAPVTEILRELHRSGDVTAVGEEYISADAWKIATRRVCAVLERYHRQHPLKRGMDREELRKRSNWRAGDWSAGLKVMAATGILTEEGTVVALPSHEGGTSTRRADADAVMASLRRSPYAPPTASELARILRADPGLLDAMAEEGEIVRIAPGLFLARDAHDRLVSMVLTNIDRAGSITAAGFRDEAGTSRKFALAFLEHLDAERITRRQGDVRIAGSRRPACA